MRREPESVTRCAFRATWTQRSSMHPLSEFVLVGQILEVYGEGSGHVFNLGHGITRVILSTLLLWSMQLWSYARLQLRL